MRPTRNQRVCCICGHLEGTRLIDEEWPVIGIGLVKVGFRVCAKCGLLMQDPVVPPGLLQQYYSQTSNYTNPGRSGLPSEEKIKAVDRQLEMLHREVQERGTAFQVGCSDGYTLHRLRKEGWVVSGIDPSHHACGIAKKLWNIDVVTGFFEEWAYKIDKRYDLIVLTHILEHLNDPVEALKISRELSKDRGHLLIEIPVLEEAVCGKAD